MITTSLSGQLECLQLAGIKHSLFISRDQCELHLWDADKLEDCLKWLEAFGVKVDSIISMNEGEDLFYIIKI